MIRHNTMLINDKTYLKWHEDTGEYMYGHPYSELHGQTENGVVKTVPNQFIPI